MFAAWVARAVVYYQQEFPLTSQLIVLGGEPVLIQADWLQSYFTNRFFTLLRHLLAWQLLPININKAKQQNSKIRAVIHFEIKSNKIKHQEGQVT